MFTIDWKPNGKDKWHYVHEKFVFKKERLNSVHMYKIYDHEELIYNTVFEHEFNKRARHVIVRGCFPEAWIVRG